MQCNFRIKFDGAEPSQTETEAVMADSIIAVYNWTSRPNCKGRCWSERHALQDLVYHFGNITVLCEIFLHNGVE